MIYDDFVADALLRLCDRSGGFVTSASGFDEDTDALPTRADARVLGATSSRRAGRPGTWRAASSLPGHGSGAVEVNGTRIDLGAAIEWRALPFTLPRRLGPAAP